MTIRTSHLFPRRLARVRRSVAGLLCASAALLSAGCEINKPAMPSFDTTLTLPLGVERLEVLEAVESEDYLHVAAGGGLLFRLTSDPDTLDFDFDLEGTISAQSIRQELGEFELGDPAPLDYGFQLQDIWAPAAAMRDRSSFVPPFPIDLISAEQDVPDVENAVLSAGTAAITVTNGLSVPISADTGADQLILTLESPVDGTTVATFTFGAIAPGSQATRTADLAGVVLPDGLRVRLSGGSPGSGPMPVPVNGSDAIAIEADLTGLLVTSATAVMDAQSFTTSFATELPENYAITAAEVSGGHLDLDVSNRLPLPCTAVISWLELRDAAGVPLVEVFDLTAGATASRSLDFTGYHITADGAVLTALTAQVHITTPGSAGQPATLAAGDGLTIDVGGGEFAFASLTGSVPEFSFAVDPLTETIDLPDELSGLALTAANLTLRLAVTSGLPGQVDLSLNGVSSSGHTATLDIREDFVSNYEQSIVTFRLDETNSSIVGFLNNLPEEVTLTGDINLGGNGQAGSVRSDDRAVVSWEIAAPVAVIVDGATLDSDPEPLDLDEDLRDRIRSHARGARLVTEILSHLPLGVQLRLVLGADSTGVDTAPLLVIGPLDIAPALVSPLTGTVTQPVVSRPVITLTAEQARLFGQPGLHTKVEAVLPSTGGHTVRVLSTDYLEVRGVVQMDLLVDDQL